MIDNMCKMNVSNFDLCIPVIWSDACVTKFTVFFPSVYSWFTSQIWHVIFGKWRWYFLAVLLDPYFLSKYWTKKFNYFLIEVYLIYCYIICSFFFFQTVSGGEDKFDIMCSITNHFFLFLVEFLKWKTGQFVMTRSSFAMC